MTKLIWFVLAGMAAGTASLLACGSDSGSVPTHPGPGFDAGAHLDGPGSFYDVSTTGPQPLPDGRVPVWSEPAGKTGIYEKYFGPGSLGHCADTVGCHNSMNPPNHNFYCGNGSITVDDDGGAVESQPDQMPHADLCYQGLLKYPLINMADPHSSKISNPDLTPLSWYMGGGQMPCDMTDASGCSENMFCMMSPDLCNTAAAEISAWVYAGAKQ